MEELSYERLMKRYLSACKENKRLEEEIRELKLTSSKEKKSK